MSQDRATCSRCQETFATQDELIVHSIEVHAGDAATRSAGASDGNGGAAASGAEPVVLDGQTTAQLRRILETRESGSGTLQALYGQRFIAAAVGAITALALALTALHAAGVVETPVYTFALGTLFGLTLAYLHAFVQAALRR